MTKPLESRGFSPKPPYPHRRHRAPSLVVPAKAGTQGRGGRAGRPRPHPSRPLSSFPRSPPLVVPAKAGTQGRGGRAARPRPHPSRPLSSFPRAPSVVPAKAGTQGRGGRAGRPPPPTRRSRESGNPGQGRMRGASPSPPFTTPLVVPPLPPLSSFPRKREPRAGADARGVPRPPLVVPAPLPSFPRKRNPGQGRMRGASPSPPPFRRSRESGNPGQGRMRGASPVPPPPTTPEAPLRTEGGPKLTLTKSGARLRDDHPVARRVEPVALAALDRSPARGWRRSQCPPRTWALPSSS